MLIKIDIRSFWRSGTGAGEAGGLDALCAVDHDGLPYLPGKHLKGLLRDAMTQAIDFGHVTDVSVAELFGELGFEHDKENPIPYSRAKSGDLRVDSARLPDADRSAILASGDNVIKHLFRSIQSTSMDKDTGAAKNKSLRLEQVAVPLVLEFEVTGPAGDDKWEGALKKALPLIRAVGQKRTRGLGRAVLECAS